MIDQEKLLSTLTQRLSDIELPEAAMDGGPSNDRYAIAMLNTSILSKIGEWIGDYNDLLPAKEVVMELAEKAIDAAMILLKERNPVLVRIFGPALKTSLLRAVSALYDSILNPDPSIEV